MEGSVEATLVVKNATITQVSIHLGHCIHSEVVC